MRHVVTTMKPHLTEFTLAILLSTHFSRLPAQTVRLEAGAAVLEWASKSNTVYRVDYSEDLGPAMYWKNLVEGYLSHGTRTYWRDAGDEIFGVSPPSLLTNRFYRVTAETNGSLPPTITMTVPDGVLSGEVVIPIAVVAPAPYMGSYLFVDGAEDAMDQDSTLTFDTTKFADGPHTIWAIAHDENGYESTDYGSHMDTGYGISEFHTVTISNSAVAGPKRRAAALPPWVNTFGVAFQGDHPSWKSLGEDVNWVGPWDGISKRVIVHGDLGMPDGSVIPRPYGPINSLKASAKAFSKELIKAGQVEKFTLANQDLAAHDYIRSRAQGGSNIFNSVNLGLLMGHGVNGLTYDWTSGYPGVLDTYFPVWTRGTQFYDWVGLATCDFGSANLRWMAIMSCNNLTQPNVDDLWEKEFSSAMIINENLHMLLGTGSTVWMVSNFGQSFARHCADGMEIREAWFAAGKESQRLAPIPPGQTVKFTCVYWPSCRHDTLFSFDDPDLDDLPEVETRQVYP